MPSTLDNWKRIQDKGYFETNITYQGINKFPEVPEIVSLIKNKVIAEIGCGYGRETFFMAKHAKKIYAIDVAESVFVLLRKYIGDNVTCVLAEKWKDIIPNNSLDYARCMLVFQHLLPEETNDYIKNMFAKLKSGGMFDAQFMVGTNFNVNPNEPDVGLSEQNILTMFKDYNIVNKQLYSGNHRGFAFTHMRIRVSKGTPRNTRKVFSESPEFLKSFKDVK